MKLNKLHYLILLSFCFASAANAQFVSVAAGELLPQDLSSAPLAGRIGGAARANFTRPSIVAVDGGIGFLPFFGIGLHYSRSRPELTLRRGDAFGSSALVDLGANTLTFDARFHTLRFSGFRAYGFVGGGFTRFTLNVKSQVEVPFPKGVPGNLTAPIATYGGGLEKKLFPYIAAKLEVRDYLTPIPSSLYQPGGVWHRVAVLGGIVLGR